MLHEEEEQGRVARAWVPAGLPTPPPRSLLLPAAVPGLQEEAGAAREAAAAARLEAEAAAEGIRAKAVAEAEAKAVSSTVPWYR